MADGDGTDEAPHELHRYPDAARMTWLAAFIYLRARSLTDDLVDLLIETIHQISARAERKVEREHLEDLKRVSGKQNLLFNLADATLAQPDGVVREVVFPVVGEQTLRDLVKEWKATGPTYRITLRTVIRNSYEGHYRRMVPTLLAALEFRSDNDRHRPVMQALELMKRFADTKVHTFPADEDVPLDDAVRGLWREAVMEKDASGRAKGTQQYAEIGRIGQRFVPGPLSGHLTKLKKPIDIFEMPSAVASMYRMVQATAKVSPNRTA